MGEFLVTYLTCDPMGWALSEGVMTIRIFLYNGGAQSSEALFNILMADICKRCLLVLLWGSFSLIISTGLALAYAYK